MGVEVWVNPFEALAHFFEFVHVEGAVGVPVGEGEDGVRLVEEASRAQTGVFGVEGVARENFLAVGVNLLTRALAGRRARARAGGPWRGSSRVARGRP